MYYSTTKMTAITAVLLGLGCFGIGTISAADDGVDKIIKKSKQYSDYTKDSYDKQKAIRLELQYLKQHEDTLSPAEKCKLYFDLGSLHSIWAPSEQEDDRKAREYYTKAIESLPGRINLNVYRARSYRATKMSTARKKAKATARVTAWVAYYLLMDEEQFRSHVVIRDGKSMTEKQRESYIKKLKSVMKNALPVQAEVVISRIENRGEPESHEGFRRYKDLFPIGALAQKKLPDKTSAKRKEGEKEKNKAKKTPDASTKTDADSAKKTLKFLFDIRWQFPNVSDAELNKVFGLLSNKKPDPREKMDLRICDWACATTQFILYGKTARHSSLNRLSKMSARERDEIVKKRKEWWKQNRDRKWGDIFRGIVGQALNTIEKQSENVIDSPRGLKHLVGYDLGYRLKRKQGRTPAQTAKHCRKVWATVKDKPWRKWKQLLADRADQTKKKLDALMKKETKEAKKRLRAQRRKLKKLYKERPEIKQFVRNIDKKWEGTKEGGKKILAWLRNNRDIWTDTSIERRFRHMAGKILEEQNPEMKEFRDEKWPKWNDTEEGRRKALQWLRENRDIWTDTLVEPLYEEWKTHLEDELEAKKSETPESNENKN